MTTDVSPEDFFVTATDREQLRGRLAAAADAEGLLDVAYRSLDTELGGALYGEVFLPSILLSGFMFPYSGMPASRRSESRAARPQRVSSIPAVSAARTTLRENPHRREHRELPDPPRQRQQVKTDREPHRHRHHDEDLDRRRDGPVFMPFADLRAEHLVVHDHRVEPRRRAVEGEGRHDQEGHGGHDRQHRPGKSQDDGENPDRTPEKPHQ